MTFLHIPRMNSRMMATPTSIKTLPTFSLGLNDQTDPSDINDAEVADIENFSIDEGVLKTAPGYVCTDSAPQSHPGPYWGGFTFIKANGTIKHIRQRQNILEYSADGITWTACTMPGTVATLTQVQPCFAALNDTVICTNGTESVISSTDGITWTAQASLPKSKVVFENAKNRLLYLAQTGTNGQYRFDWSDINQPLTVQAASYELVDPNNNGMVIGAALTPDGTSLIHKEGGVYSVADIVDDGIVDINFIGKATCINHHTIATTNNSVIWAGYSGVYEYMGGTIQNIFGHINPLGRNNSSSTSLFCGAFFNNKYHLSMPDTTVSTTYNSQEYIIYKKIVRSDAVQPYVITRNKRYFGCYWVADSTASGTRNMTLYVGDSRPVSTTGSPAQYVNTLFGWVNDYRNPTLGGLNGSAQTCYFTTKYFTEGIPYYSKKFKRLFSYISLSQTTGITLSYRFLPTGGWVDMATSVQASAMEFSEGYDFSEGYSFIQDTSGTVFVDINNPEKPRGIQFKISLSTTKDLSILSMAFSFLPKLKFK